MTNKKERKKTQIDEMDRGIYDIKNKFEYRSKTETGLSEEIVRQISYEKNEPDTFSFQFPWDHVNSLGYTQIRVTYTLNE